jgi:hypothetical protein
MEPALRSARIDVTWGEGEETCRLGGYEPNARDRFEVLARIAGQKLGETLDPQSDSGRALLSEPNLVTRWYKALWKVGKRLKPAFPFEDIDGNIVRRWYAGSMDRPAEASALLCLELAATQLETKGRDEVSFAKSELYTEIRSGGGEIVRLITEMNERYAAQFGTDLIKATNKTARSLSRIGTPIQDYQGYETFVDDLYFLFHEGVGNRLVSKTPESFKDVRTLRTQLRHDLDHGKPAEAQAKRRKAGEVFKKYIGEASPVGLAPERFAIVQANILAALKQDLKTLSW